MKNKYSIINEIAESMLEDENTCHGCPFEYLEYSSEGHFLFATCNHKHAVMNTYDDLHRCNHNKRPDNCPIRWRNLKCDDCRKSVNKLYPIKLDGYEWSVCEECFIYEYCLEKCKHGFVDEYKNLHCLKQKCEDVESYKNVNINYCPLGNFDNIH